MATPGKVSLRKKSRKLFTTKIQQDEKDFELEKDQIGALDLTNSPILAGNLTISNLEDCDQTQLSPNTTQRRRNLSPGPETKELEGALSDLLTEDETSFYSCDESPTKSPRPDHCEENKNGEKLSDPTFATASQQDSESDDDVRLGRQFLSDSKFEKVASWLIKSPFVKKSSDPGSGVLRRTRTVDSSGGEEIDPEDNQSTSSYVGDRSSKAPLSLDDSSSTSLALSLTRHLKT